MDENDWRFLPSEARQYQTLWLYPGYIGCNSECPVGLNAMSRQLSSKSDSQNETGFYFVNTLDQYNSTQAAAYAQQFHSEIQGITLDQQQLNTFSILTGYRIQRAWSSESTYQHTDWFFRLDRTPDGWTVQRFQRFPDTL
jgi:cytochrome oxidase Cu insertion factor (SCO1/SenC/PrrC family)